MTASSTSLWMKQPQRQPLVGREAEQARLSEHLDEALAGRGSLVLISGEAGIGKTALVTWLADVARRQGTPVLQGCAYDLTATPPYGLWLDALADGNPAGGESVLRHLRLEQGAEPGGITSQAVIFDRVRSFLTMLVATRPAMFVLEDLHWSDPASLEVLRYLARGIDTLGLLLIGTYRADELTRQHPLFQLLPLLVREASAERIDLRVLTDDDVSALVTSRYALSADDATHLVTYLQSRAEGNPFYLCEVLRTLETERLLYASASGWLVGDLEQAPVPPLIRQVIEGRLEKLDEGTRRLLEVAAVIGQEVPLDVWQIASDADDDQLSHAVGRAVDAHIILQEPNTRSISFSHALIRETLYNRQPLEYRRRLHQRMADMLMHRLDPPLDIVASHLSQADDPRAIDWLIRAGERALALYAAHDAVATLSRAHMLAARFGQKLPLTAYRARASAYTLLGDFDHARRDQEIALERGRASDDTCAEWQALADLGMLWAERDYERTGNYYRAALDLARTIGNTPLIASSLNRIANWHVNQDAPDVALPLHQDALALFEECGDWDGIADTLDRLGLAGYLNCDWLSSARYWERSIALSRELGDRQRLSSSLAMITGCGGTLDCDITVPVYRESAFWMSSGEEGLAVAREIGWAAGEAFALIMLSMASGVRGHFGRARRGAVAALSIAEQIDHRQWVVFARYVLGAIWKELLNWRRAQDELEQALARARMSGSQFLINRVATTLASLYISEGDLSHAAATLGTVAGSDQPGPSMAQRHHRFVHAELALARSQPDRALTIIDQLRSTSPSATPRDDIPQLMKLRADALVRLDQLHDAEEAYRIARDGAKLFGFRPLLWRIESARSELYRAAGRMQDAAEASRDAQVVVEELAESIDDEAIGEHFRARASARLPDAQSSEDVPGSAARLSPRELDVLRLLAEGTSDREIADALFISPRTVNRHVTAILNKIGANTRTAAAAIAIRRGMV